MQIKEIQQNIVMKVKNRKINKSIQTSSKCVQ